MLAETNAKLQLIHDQSRKRISRNGATVSPIIVGLAAFEAAGPEPSA